MTVCAICQYRLYARQGYFDRQLRRQQVLQQHAAMQRQWFQLQQLRLHHAQLRAQAQLAAMRERNRIMLFLIRNKPNGWWYLR